VLGAFPIPAFPKEGVAPAPNPPLDANDDDCAGGAPKGGGAVGANPPKPPPAEPAPKPPRLLLLFPNPLLPKPDMIPEDNQTMYSRDCIPRAMVLIICYRHSFLPSSSYCG
jgi:hypothetical protein